MLSTRLYCQPSRQPGPVGATSVRLAGEPVRGSEVTLVGTGLVAHRGQSASVWFNEVVMGTAPIEPDGSYHARLILPDTQSGTFRLVLDDDGQELGRSQFSASPAPSGTAFRSVMVDECGPHRVEFEGRTWVLPATATMPSLPGGRAPGTLRVIDDRHASFDPDGMDRVNLVPDGQAYAC